jgi:hypothetical protein
MFPARRPVSTCQPSPGGLHPHERLTLHLVHVYALVARAPQAARLRGARLGAWLRRLSVVGASVGAWLRRELRALARLPA